MSTISEEITRLNNAKNAIKTAIEGKGVAIGDDELIDAYAEKIDTIQIKEYPELSQDNLNEYLTFTCRNASKTVTLTKTGSPTAKVFYYSFDKEIWTAVDMTDQTSVEITTSATACAPMYWKADGAFCNGGADRYNDYYHFVFADQTQVSGNIMSLLGDGWQTMTSIPTEYCFVNLFVSSTATTDISMLALPATTLTTGCYMKMFNGCSYLYGVMSCLPAKSLPKWAYYQMFFGTRPQCMPDLLAEETTGAEAMYEMFRGDYNLLYINLSNSFTTFNSTDVYRAFYLCRNLKKAILPDVKTLTSKCYQNLFNGGCTNLTYVKCLATDISATNCVTNMLNGVAETGTFVCAAGMADTWRNSDAAIPSGWTIEEVDE